MLAVVYYSVDIAQFKNTFLQVPLLVIVLVAIGYALSQVINSVKWWILARAAGLHVSFLRILTAAFIGQYVNCFGLGTVGGDLTRALLITGSGERKEVGLATVVADRTLGLAVLALIGIISVSVFHSTKLDLGIVHVALGFALLVLGGWALAPKIVPFLLRRWPKLQAKIAATLKAFPAKPSVLFSVIFLSVCFHLLQISLFAVIGRGFGVEIPFSYLLVAIPFSNIISTLPLSWMGLGIRENVYVFFFVPAYLSHEQAVISGAIWLLGMTIASALGGIISILYSPARHAN